MSIGPSVHLSWAELTCRDQMHSPYPINWRDVEDRSRALGLAFEALRAECCIALGRDCPLVVGEGYRTEAYQTMLRRNPRYKAALHSQHCEGRAVDVYLPRGLTFDEFSDCARRAACWPNVQIKYIELRPSMGYIHIDTRITTKKLIVETIA